MAENHCSICFESLLSESERVQTLRCGHPFHRLCLDRWFQEKTSCPLCRDEQKYDELIDTLSRLRRINNLEINDNIIDRTERDGVINHLLARFSVPFLGRLLEVALRNTNQPILHTNERPISFFLENNENDWLPIATQIIRILRN
jgi:hypothetical protein